MIAWLKGTLRAKSPTRLVLDVNGVGYEVLTSLSTYAALPDKNETVELQVRTYVRDGAFQLYGFATALEKAAFELLLHANRVGPKLAQTMLSGGAAAELVAAIERGDAAALQNAPGVGAKTAARICVELRERAAECLAEFSGAAAGDSSAGGAAGAAAGAAPVRAELVSALVNLQTPRAKAERSADAAIGALGPEAPIHELVRRALRSLAR